MKLILILKICVMAAFVGTIFTGFLFLMHSSDADQMKVHAKDIYISQASGGSDFKFSKNDNNLESKIGSYNFQKKEFVKNTIEEKDNNLNVVKMPFQPKIVELEKQELSTNAPTTTTTTTTATTTTSTPSTTTATANVETIALKVLKELKETSRTPSVHIFYYPWYGSPQFNNGKYFNWNRVSVNIDNTAVNETNKYNPPRDISSIYYPELGPYSSRDPIVIERHMKWLSSSGVDVIAVLWRSKENLDSQDMLTDVLLPLLLNITEKFKIKLTFHFEPYNYRSAESVREDIKYIISTYGSYPAFYRTTGKSDLQKSLPLFYIYNSNLIETDDWLKLTSANGTLSIRNTDLDSLLIGLYENAGDDDLIKKAGFDGLYTYFATDGFSHGSTMSNWPQISTFCAKENLLFIPSVGPGYDDSRIRPWNSKNTRFRNNGEYYKEHFKMAHTAKADIVSITSFNQWHEGTQIEPAVTFTDTNKTGYAYSVYEKGPEQYLEITLEMVKAYFTPHNENIPMQIARVV